MATSTAIVGVVVVWSLMAAGTPVAFEAESGTVASGASSAATSGASAGAALKFAVGTGFTHPGVLLGQSQLDFVKAKLAAGQDPWITAYTKMMSAQVGAGSNSGQPFASLALTPHPVATVECLTAPASGQPASCNDEINDAIAAYADTLAWYYDHNVGTNREAYAQKAIQILNGWSAQLTGHTGSGVNDALNASWTAQVMTRAAEILRYEYSPSAGKPGLNVANFTTMLNTAFLPTVDATWGGGGANLLMSMADATVNIGVFTNNRTVFNSGLTRWRTLVPSIFYASTDTNDGYVNLKGKGFPIPPLGISWVNPNVSTNTMNSYWYNPISYVDGLQGETCRDPAHVAMGFGAAADAAETARLQGVDLYGEQQSRLVKSLEANSGWLVAALKGTALTGWSCAAAMADPQSNATWKTTYEIIYNEYANRRGLSLPNTSALLTQFARPSGFKAFVGMDFEGLTHPGTP